MEKRIPIEEQNAHITMELWNRIKGELVRRQQNGESLSKLAVIMGAASKSVIFRWLNDAGMTGKGVSFSAMITYCKALDINVAGFLAARGFGDVNAPLRKFTPIAISTNRPIAPESEQVAELKLKLAIAEARLEELRAVTQSMIRERGANAQEYPQTIGNSVSA